jgi:hypothetical protein
VTGSKESVSFFITLRGIKYEMRCETPKQQYLIPDTKYPMHLIEHRSIRVVVIGNRKGIKEFGVV